MNTYDDPDKWVSHGQKITAQGKLEAIRQCMENGPIILEHRFYRGARAPARIVFDEFEVFAKYLENQANPGDAFYIWDYTVLCRDDNAIAYGKYPDKNDRVPEGGAY